MYNLHFIHRQDTLVATPLFIKLSIAIMEINSNVGSHVDHVKCIFLSLIYNMPATVLRSVGQWHAEL
jgi:hypothetical protein